MSEKTKSNLTLVGYGVIFLLTIIVITQGVFLLKGKYADTSITAEQQSSGSKLGDILNNLDKEKSATVYAFMNDNKYEDLNEEQKTYYNSFKENLEKLLVESGSSLTQDWDIVLQNELVFAKNILTMKEGTYTIGDKEYTTTEAVSDMRINQLMEILPYITEIEEIYYEQTQYLANTIVNDYLYNSVVDFSATDAEIRDFLYERLGIQAVDENILEQELKFMGSLNHLKTLFPDRFKVTKEIETDYKKNNEDKYNIYLDVRLPEDMYKDNTSKDTVINEYLTKISNTNIDFSSFETTVEGLRKSGIDMEHINLLSDTGNKEAQTHVVNGLTQWKENTTVYTAESPYDMRFVILLKSSPRKYNYLDHDIQVFFEILSDPYTLISKLQKSNEISLSTEAEAMVKEEKERFFKFARVLMFINNLFEGYTEEDLKNGETSPYTKTLFEQETVEINETPDKDE